MARVLLIYGEPGTGKSTLGRNLHAGFGWHAMCLDSEYAQFMEAVSLAGGAHGVANTATSLLLLLEVFERHVEDLAEGFVPTEGGSPRKGKVPAAAALGALQVPASTAAALAKLLGRAPAATKFRALEEACIAWVDANDQGA